MSEYVPRLTAPSYDNPLWIQINSGGYNRCIYGSNGAPSVLPNCTGYVHGRCMEIAGVTSDDLGLSFGNAVQYYGESSADWERTSEPSLGAVACYESLPWLSLDAPHPGHVAIVEEIIDADTVVISQSDYGRDRFSTWTIRREWNWSPFQNYADWGVSFQGFLKNPYVDDEPTPTPPTPTGDKQKYVIMFLAKKRKEAQHGRVKRYSRFI